MKPTFSRFIVLLLLIVFADPSRAFAQGKLFDRPTGQCKAIALLIESAQANHYSPFMDNREMEKRTYRLFMHKLDPDGLYFTQKDIDQLPKLSIELGAKSQVPACDYVSQVTRLYQAKIADASELVTRMTKEMPQYSSADTVSFGFPWTEEIDLRFAADNQDWEYRWERHLKFQILYRLLAKNDSIVEASGWSLDPVKSQEPAIREKIAEGLICKFDRLLDGDAIKKKVLKKFLEAAAESYDPHTKYFSVDQQQVFESSLSSSGYTFGIDLGEENEGELEIVNLIPGSPAWKSGQLNKGDLVTSIRFGQQPEVKIDCGNTRKVIALIHSTNELLISITVKKKNGKIRTLKLAKEKVASSDNQVASYLLSGNKKIGYVQLPAFYTEWENHEMPGCANDVAKAILKLDRQGMEGMILDLRNNGGGSMKEAIDLTGIFVDYGTLGISKSNRSDPVLIKDSNRGIIFNGPLIVLVNKLSASASEVLSAALKEHSRALIVGSPTYGKATAQVVAPLGLTVTISGKKDMAVKADGYIKMTIKRLYDPAGNSHQAIGVQPHIVLPDLLSSLVAGEESEPYAFANDTSKKKGYYRKWKDIPVGSLKSASQQRTRNNDMLKSLNTTLGVVKTNEEKGFRAILSIEDFPKGIKTYMDVFEKLTQEHDFKTDVYKAKATQDDLEISEISDHHKDLTQAQIDNLESDWQLEESYRIMLDWLDLSK